MGNRIRTRNSPDIFLGMILQFEFLSKSVLKRRQNPRLVFKLDFFFLGFAHLLGALHVPSAIFLIKEVMVDARHAPMGFFPSVIFAWTEGNEFFIKPYRVLDDSEFFIFAVFIRIPDVALRRNCQFKNLRSSVSLSKSFGILLLQVIDTPYSVELNMPYGSSEGQYVVLSLQNTRIVWKNRIHCLGCRKNTLYLGRKFDTSYPTGGYAVSGVLPEQNTF
ncbi:hypothetical protein Tco_0658477 [Tanacetum coccineum]